MFSDETAVFPNEESAPAPGPSWGKYYSIGTYMLWTKSLIRHYNECPCSLKNTQNERAVW